MKLLIDNNPRVVAAKAAEYPFVGGQLQAWRSQHGENFWAWLIELKERQ